MNEQQSGKSVPIHRRPWLVAALVGLVVMLISFLSVWLRGGMYFMELRYVKVELNAHEDAIEEYREAHGQLPPSLDEIDLGGMQGPDPWGRPYIYRIEGESYDVCTLGRDGKSGGQGLDADICLSDSQELPQPTLWQFLVDNPRSPMVILSIVLTGLAAALLTRLTPPTQHTGVEQQITAWLFVLITIFAAFIVATGLAGAHIPSHH
jgi:general secretion pathway protein G